MKITELTKRSIMFTVPEDGEGGIVNMNLILGKKHNFIIDTGTGESNVKAMLDYIGNDTKPIITIITHAHWDHIFGNSALKDEIIVSHTLARSIMDESWDTVVERILKERGEFVDANLHKCLPNLLFENSLHFPEDGISLFHTPGHSDDGISVYDAVDKALYVGDNFGVFDGVAYLWAKDPQDSRNFIEMYRKYDIEICIPSHSEPQTGVVMGLLDAALEKVENA